MGKGGPHGQEAPPPAKSEEESHAQAHLPRNASPSQPVLGRQASCRLPRAYEASRSSSSAPAPTCARSQGEASLPLNLLRERQPPPRAHTSSCSLRSRRS